MPSLIQELNEALALWGSLLPYRPTSTSPPLMEKREAAPDAVFQVPDSLPLLRSGGPFLAQTAEEPTIDVAHFLKIFAGKEQKYEFNA